MGRYLYNYYLMIDSNDRFKNLFNNVLIMEGIVSSSNQNQSKTSEELVKKNLDKAIAAYAFYSRTKGHALEGVLEVAPQALPPLLELIKNLENFGKCQGFSTNDPKSLEQCIDEYTFGKGVLNGIWHYTFKNRTPEQIERFTKGLETLANGGEEIIEGLYKRYQQYKTSIPPEDVDPRVLEIVPEAWAIGSLILQYLENPKVYGKKLNKYLGKKLLKAGYLSVLEEALSKIPSLILQYLKGYRKVEMGEKEGRKKVEMGEKEIRKGLKEAARNYVLYASSMINAREVVSYHAPEALPSLATLIENLERWGKSNLLTNDPKALEEAADKYQLMQSVLASLLGWSVSKFKHTPEEIERFKKGLETLANGGEEIIEGLYRLFKEVERSKLESTPSYDLIRARVNAGWDIEDLLVKYFKNPEEHEDQIMKYVEKPLRQG